MKYACLLILLFLAQMASGQDVLINSSKISSEQTPVSKPIKPDSLSTSNQEFIMSIQKSYKEADTKILSDKELNSISKREIDNKESEIREKIKAQYSSERQRLEREQARVRAENAALANKNKKLFKRAAQIEKANSELKTNNIRLKEQVELITSINREQNLYFDKIVTDRNALKKISSQIKLTLDSLNELKNQIGISRVQIKKNNFKIPSLSSLFDTTFTRANKVSIIDSLSSYSTRFSTHDENAKDLNDDIIGVIQVVDQALLNAAEHDSALSKAYQLTKDLIKKEDSLSNESLNKIELKSRAILSILNSVIVEDDNKNLIKIRDAFKLFSSAFIKIKNDYNNSDKQFVGFFNKQFTEKKPSFEETEFGAFPNISYLIGEQRTLNLNISILGSYTKLNDDKFNSFEARLFTGSVPKSLSNARSLFIPEASTFGTQIKYTTGYKLEALKPGRIERKTVTNLGGTFELNLLSKRLAAPSSVTTTNPGSSTLAADDLNNFIIHLRTGGELVILKDVFSIYGNLNWVSLVDNVEKFHDEFESLTLIDNKSSWTYFDFGCRLLLNPSGGDAKKVAGSGLKIVADFNLIVPKKWGRQIINGVNTVDHTDMFLPVIRIGVKKSLGFIHEK